MEKYVIRDKEAGNIIEYVYTLKEAKNLLKKFETIDKKEGTYSTDFYEIVKIK